MNTYNKTIKDDPKDRIEIEIGDSKQANFYPQLKIMRWDNEVNASFRLLGDTGTHSKQGNVVKYVSDKREAHFYDIAPNTEHPEGGFELEVILKEKPATNKVEFSMQSKGLEFFYQPELTQKEKDDGAERPENVIGSYAVYHKTKGGMNNAAGMEYKCGKAFHIYRPRIEDANGDWVWGELNITGNNLTVTIPQAFLDSAVYPVIVDPTFGFTSVGASSATWNDRIRGTSYTSTESGDATSITAHVFKNTTSGSLFGIYQRSDDVLQRDTGLTNNSQNPIGWLTENLSSSVSITAQDYVLAAFSIISAGTTLSYDSVSVHRYFKSDAGGSSFPDPFDGTIGTANFKYSIYANYTPAAPSTVLKDLLGVGIIPFPR